MRRGLVVAAGIVLVAFGVAHAATDPAAILNAYRAASGGDAWNGKVVMKTESKLSGQGLTGTDTSITELRTGNSVERTHWDRAAVRKASTARTPGSRGRTAR